MLIIAWLIGVGAGIIILASIVLAFWFKMLFSALRALYLDLAYQWRFGEAPPRGRRGRDGRYTIDQ